MDISRVSFKVFMDRGQDVTTETWFEVFNTWIPDPHEDVLVDVADYNHVKDAPQTILVGHRANYAVDTTGGRFGFLYARKRDLDGSFEERLEDAIRSGLQACKRLDDDDALDGQIHFNGESTQVTLNDRLDAKNDEKSFAALQSALTPILDRLYEGANYEIERDTDERRPLTVDVRASKAFTPAQMLDNLAG